MIRLGMGEGWDGNHGLFLQEEAMSSGARKVPRGEVMHLRYFQRDVSRLHLDFFIFLYLASCLGPPYPDDDENSYL